MKFPDKKYGIIYADPPWTYRDRLSRGRRILYKQATIEEISRFPVHEIAADDCFLFLWVTVPLLNEIWPILDNWGFTYKTVAFVWVKTIKRGRSLAWGMGRWTRSNAELCLLATRGKPKRLARNVHSVVLSPVREHSQKPDEVRDRIVKLCGDLPRIELFSRDKVAGWDCWGDQAPKELRRSLLG